MNLKSRAMMPLIFLTIGIGLFSALQLFLTGGAIAWLGALLAALVFPLFLFVVVGSGRVARTSARFPVVQIVAAAGLGLSIYGVLHQGRTPSFASYLSIVCAMTGFFILQWYVWIYSSYGRRPSGAIAIGRPLPDAPFETLDGRTVTPADFAGSRTLIVFFRGNWCPLCMAQLKELRDRADRLAAASVRTKFVSNQSVERSAELAEKLDLPSHFEILFDRDLRAAKALSIVDAGGTPAGMKGYPADTVMATVIALDAEGRVVFGDETDNYRVRPHPDAFLPHLGA